MTPVPTLVGDVSQLLSCDSSCVPTLVGDVSLTKQTSPSVSRRRRHPSGSGTSTPAAGARPGEQSGESEHDSDSEYRLSHDWPGGEGILCQPRPGTADRSNGRVIHG